MDASVSATMIQSSEADVLMEGNGNAHESNGIMSNGFMDPRVLNRLEDLDLPDSTEEAYSRDESLPSTADMRSVTPRKAFLPTGCCYDDRMQLHANADFSANPHHPEDPRRIVAIMQSFKDAGLVYTGDGEDLAELLKVSPTKWMWRIAAREATKAEICLVHTVAHFEWVRALAAKSSAELRQMTNEYDMGRKSLYVGNLTYQAALISAGGAIETCKNVVAGNVKNAIAVIRPPGHHAEYNESLGFCIFNNVPIAAKVCMADYPDTCRKILILDWDVHHGNGIQNMFYNEPNVLYISLHVYQDGKFYPGQPDDPGIPDGGLDQCGIGAGLGKNVNIGWADQGVGDGEYMAAFQKIVMPIAQEFDPDLVIISAGFDAAAGDELGGCWVTPGCYSHMTHMLMSLANGKVAVCLEGGYNLPAISRSALAVAKTLMGEPPERLSVPPLNMEASHTLHNVRRIQANYWDCMRPGVLPLLELQERGTERISDVMRIAQKSKLADKYDMTPLYVQRTKLSRSFDNQILVTPDIYKAKKILLIIHDPPELYAQPDPYDTKVYPHNTYMDDGISPYIDWAISNGFGVIDVNIPQYISSPTDTDPYMPKSSEPVLGQQMKELLCYLWDNYFEVNTTSSIFLMGVGDAYLGIKQLLTSRDAKGKIPGVLSFVSGSLRPVKSDVDQYLSQWYKSNSLIYVSPDHACWSDEESARKVRKNRFGKVEKGDVRGVGAMLRRYLPQATSFITTKVTEWERENGDGKDPDETDEEDILANTNTNNNGNGNNADLDEMMANGEVLGMQSIRAPVGIALAHVN